MATKWLKFPHADKTYAYDTASLKKNWARLHKGDCEPYPKEAAVIDAWRHYHAGDFQSAVEVGRAAGGAGVNTAVKAQSIYANYLEKSDKTKLALFEEAAAWADERRDDELEPRHAEACTAYGAYQAEVIDKVGGIVAGMTYGAKKDSALEHFQKALKLFPESPIAHIEYANGLLLLFGKEKIGEASKLYEKAAAARAADAMERLDIELAKSELE